MVIVCVLDSSPSSLSLITIFSVVFGLSSVGGTYVSFASLTGSELSTTSSLIIIGLSPKKKSMVWLLSELSNSQEVRGYLKY